MDIWQKRYIARIINEIVNVIFVCLEPIKWATSANATASSSSDWPNLSFIVSFQPTHTERCQCLWLQVVIVIHSLVWFVKFIISFILNNIFLSFNHPYFTSTLCIRALNLQMPIRLTVHKFHFEFRLNMIKQVIHSPTLLPDFDKYFTEHIGSRHCLLHPQKWYNIADVSWHVPEPPHISASVQESKASCAVPRTYLPRKNGGIHHLTKTKYFLIVQSFHKLQRDTFVSQICWSPEELVTFLLRKFFSFLSLTLKIKKALTII